MRVPSLAFFVTVALSMSSLAYAQKPARDEAGPLAFSGKGHTFYGDWVADVTVSHEYWQGGDAVQIGVRVQFSEAHLAGLAAAGVKADRLCVLVTAERTFDADGWMRLPSDERMSTLLTPTGLAIEGGVQGAVTNRFGYEFRSPLDEFATIPVGSTTPGTGGTRVAAFALSATLPEALPPGLYRLRTDIGVMVGTRLYNFNGYSFAVRPFTPEAGTSTYFYSPLVPASGRHVSGRFVNALTLKPRIPWLLLSNYNSNGYRGVVAEEDKARFATSDRSLIPDEVILPLLDDAGARRTYSLEPQFPADTIDALQNLPWSWTGELSVRVTAPDGTTQDLGTAPIQGKSGSGPTTKKTAFTAWTPKGYGRYTVVARGWVADQQGRRYEGGGTYRFWIAKRMTLATATFQGMPYPVGSSYGRDTQFNPPFPADVQVTATLYPNSDVNAARSTSYSGKASAAGVFGAAQGMKPFPLTSPGEYHAQVLATYTDAEGHLWVSTMRHAGIVYEEPGPVVARGKKLGIGGKYLDRGNTATEGYVEPDGDQHLQHLTFPYQSGDVLLIAAEGQGANKIEPVLTYQMAGDTSAWDTRLNGVGTTNLRITTANGYSPHLYPEYITSLEYYYAAAPRPGFMGRFLVGESTVRAPYWPVSPNSFGGQIGASPNGDAPGDIYRLLGGIVMRRHGQSPMYAGYISSAFLLPRGSNSNRVVAPGSEDLIGPTGATARFFLVGLRPGSSFEVGSTFRPALQIDPLLPVSVRFVLTYPDGRTRVEQGTGDRFGSFAGSTPWPLDVPGVYRYQVTATWNGWVGTMPGLPESGGHFYVYSSSRPASASGLRLDGPSELTFPAAAGTVISGSSTAASVHYAVITPGAVLDQGQITVRGGKFQYAFDPQAMHARVPLYDVTSIITGKPQLGRVVHITFFAEERVGGQSYFDFARVILRGTTALLPQTGLRNVAPGSGGDAVRAAAPANPAVMVTATDSRQLREWDDTLNSLLRDGELRVVSREADPLLPGRLHERLQQFHRGIPVFGAELTRQVDRGLTVSIFGSIHRRLDIETVPAINEDDAAAIVEARVGGRLAEGTRPELAIVVVDGQPALTWQAKVGHADDASLVFVHASDAEVVLRCAATPPGEASPDGAAGAAPLVLHRAAALFARGFGVSAPAIPLDSVPSGPLDVVAHRLGHAVTRRLIPRGESAALAEAFADIVAGAVNREAGVAAWYELSPLSPGGERRSLAPHAGRGSTDDAGTSYTGDAGRALRESAAIASRAFFLAASEGTRRDHGNLVAGSEARSVARAFYRAFAFLLPADASFSAARAATLQSVRDLHGAGSDLERAVAVAWRAVGIER